MEMNSVENYNLLSPETSGRIVDYPPSTTGGITPRAIEVAQEIGIHRIMCCVM